MKTSEIKLKVTIDEKNIPQSIGWSASDFDNEKLNECKAFITAMWDGVKGEALHYEVWTSEMRVDEMNMFLFQNLLTMSEIYKRATQNSEIADKIKEFAFSFGEEVQIVKKS